MYALKKCKIGAVGARESGEQTSKETVELDEEFEIDIVAFRGFSMGTAHMMSVEIDT